MGICDGQAFEILPAKSTEQRAFDCVEALTKEKARAERLSHSWKESYYEARTGMQDAKADLYLYKRKQRKLLIVVNSAWAILVTLLFAFMWG